MDGIVDCDSRAIGDSSDEETSLVCDSFEFKCDQGNNNSRCIPREWVKDGNKDCISGNDESNGLSQCFDVTEFRCVSNGRCIPRYRVLDGYNDCENGTDEAYPLTCISSKEVRCSNGRCIPQFWLENKAENCLNESEKAKITVPNVCASDEFRCHNGRRCIPKFYQCDGMDHCGDCSDEIESCEEPRMFRCPNDPSNKCIQTQYSCDAFKDCLNGEDDITSLTGFKCKFNLVDPYCNIPQWSLSDEYSVCKDKSDLCYANGTFKCARCLNSVTVIAPHQICDGIIDCPDLSDECLCSDVKDSAKVICDNVCYGGSDLACGTCEHGEVLCKSEELCIKPNMVCDGKIDCPLSRQDEASCEKLEPNFSKDIRKDFNCDVSRTIFQEMRKSFSDQAIEMSFPLNATRCNGIVECSYFEDECDPRLNCSTRPAICDTYPKMEGSFPEEPKIRLCPNTFHFVTGWSICNGIIDCLDKLDESNCPDRFECDTGVLLEELGPGNLIISIPKNKVCDLKPDCKDKRDEKNCSDETHFYCTNDEPLFVPRSKVLDGVPDCQDSSDECPPSYFNSSAVSSREELIKSPVLKVLIWLMATLALCGNSAVAFTTVKSLLPCIPTGKMTNITMINRFLILNLSVSDLLMGIALLVIGIKSSQFSGQYCHYDKSWRTSFTCTGIGILIILSSETSVLTLVCITSYRLYSVFCPLRTRFSKKRFLAGWLFLIWSSSFIIAVLPLVKSFSQQMVTAMWASGKNLAFFESDIISLAQFKTYVHRIAILSQRNISSTLFNTWSEMESFLLTNNEDYAPTLIGHFGYYSSSGVCIPRFYKTTGDTANINLLSSVVITFNFIALVYIAVAYVILYNRSAKTGRQVHKPRKKEQQFSKAMQRKITLLIATDICCWLPICIMTFVSMGGIVLSPITYAVSAIVLLPINSALNPLIYTNAVSVIWQKCAGDLRQIATRFRGRLNDQGSVETCTHEHDATGRVVMATTLL